MTFVYQKALIQTFHTKFLTTKNLCEFTAQKHKLKGNFVLKKGFKYFW